MRLSLSLDDDLYRAAKALAQSRDISIGRAVNELLRRALEAPPQSARREALSDFPISPGHGGRRITARDVRAADDDDDETPKRRRS